MLAEGEEKKVGPGGGREVRVAGSDSLHESEKIAKISRKVGG